MLQTIPSCDAQLFSAQAVAEARQRFFSGETAPQGIAAPILRSWTRCVAHGLPAGGRLPAEPLGAGELRQRREKAESLRRRCRPELEALHADAAVTGSLVILTDPTGLVLDTVGSADFADRAAKVALLPGVSWSESVLGTNAIGTALVERRPLEVRGGEHYAEAHGILSCAAAPILDPYGDVIGLLDLSGPAAVAHLHAMGLVQLAVSQVEHRLFEGAFPGLDVVRFHADASFLGTSREGILVFEDYRLVAANRPGLAQLGLGWDALKSRRYSDLFDGSLGRPGEDRRVRSTTGDTLHARVERQPARAPAPPSTPRAAPAAGPRPVAAPEPCFDAATEQALGRAVRLLEAGVPVLIQGETGSGKDIFSRQMHGRSSRAGRPFAAVNCAALPEGLIESELFGYEDGAFTGARRAGFKGLLREADGGILFLDEIGDMPLALQTRLLRVLQEREVTPLGGGKPVPVDFSLVCATHRDLKQLVDAGAFRADLYFRIAQYTVALPALRHLPDREALVHRFWRELAGGAPAPALSAACVEALARYSWPGNFRQFVGTLKVLHALADPGGSLGPEALPAELRDSALQQPQAGTRPSAPDEAPHAPGGACMGDDLQAVTRATIQAALAACNGNISMAARRLGIHRSTLHRHLAATPGHRKPS
ncbi:sigma-54-dependent Fis family transcriptional regulator [Xanthobacter agilis]|uniref:Transcriptional regulator of acetoin/glycerol metabolism n=1 Tax=Xanthobacter agilis TaxID=47492 RepID=A0ABU0LJ85_XANAG|nr:sigma-54-dependent Fis family transcriptional regulator [Xanthobacter agilis]MDQ0507201.1 transcriptional regulator of acetoin/glycerol metabolism [Xanthobacter agilis]